MHIRQLAGALWIAVAGFCVNAACTGSLGDSGQTTATSSSIGGAAGSTTTGGNGNGGGGMGQGGTSTASGGAGGSAGAGGFTNPANKLGIGLVSPGNTTQWDRSKELTGRGGHIKLIFPGVTKQTSEPPQDWVTAVSEVYARDLVPVIRLGPPWGDRDLRKDSDDASHKAYKQLAQAYRAVVAKLPLREGWPLVIEIHNEPNLCYEWACNPNDVPSHPQAAAGWIHYEHTAAEYAAFMRDVADALHAIGDPRILVTNGGLAPGGTVSCECGGEGFQPGITSKEFIQAMASAVPGLFAKLDAWSSHPYPASGEGYGFFESYEKSIVGLHYFEKELQTVGLSLPVSLPVYITETGWTVAAGAMGSRQDVADWTVQAWDKNWLPHPDIVAVMPFMLQDSSWDAFAWIDAGNNPYPVFSAVRAWRCSKNIPEPCQ